MRKAGVSHGERLKTAKQGLVMYVLLADLCLWCGFHAALLAQRGKAGFVQCAAKVLA